MFAYAINIGEDVEDIYSFGQNKASLSFGQNNASRIGVLVIRYKYWDCSII